MRAAAYQFDVVRSDVAANLGAVEEGLRAAREDGCRLVVLPEMWSTSFADLAPDRGPGALVRESERALERVAELSAELGLVVAGTTPVVDERPFAERCGADRAAPAGADGLPFNRLTVFADGDAVLEYDKVHLFSPTAEEASFRAGDAPPAVVSTAAGELTGATCYDLRFPELFQPAFRAGAQVVVCPAQWPDPRMAHWRALALGRAVELQAFVVACNRTGTDRVGRRQVELHFPGNSLIVDPHGRVLAEGTGPTGLVAADLDLEATRRIRVRVPIAKDRRDDLYRGW